MPVPLTVLIVTRKMSETGDQTYLSF